MRSHALMGDAYFRSRDRLAESNATTSEMKRCWLGQWATSTLYRAEIERLAPNFAANGLSPVILKGLALQVDVYEDPGQRPLSDIDLLIDEGDWSAIPLLMRQMGYREKSEDRWRGNEFKQNWLRQNSEGAAIEVEFHRRLFFSEPPGFRWRTRQAFIEPFRVLENEDLLVHLIGHLAFQHTFLKLYWLVDIDRLIRKFGEKMDRKRVADNLSRLRLEASAKAVFYVCQKFLGTPLDGEWLKLAASPGWHWRALLSEAFLAEPDRHPVRYYALKHLLKDSIYEAIVYDLYWVLHAAKGGARSVLRNIRTSRTE